MRHWVAIIALLLVAGTAWADERPAKVPGSSNSNVVYMCNAQSGTGVCTSSGGDQVVLDTASLSDVSFVSVGSTGTYSCDIVGNNTGHDAASGTGQTLNSTSLSGSQLAITLSKTPRFVWINCTANSGAVTVTAFGRLTR